MCCALMVISVALVLELVMYENALKWRLIRFWEACLRCLTNCFRYPSPFAPPFLPIGSIELLPLLMKYLIVLLFSLSRPILGRRSFSRSLKGLLILIKLIRMVLRSLYIFRQLTNYLLIPVYGSKIPKFVIKSIISNRNRGYRRP